MVALVYIDEAHAEDEWPISSSRFNGNRGAVNVHQTRTLQERRAVAADFARDFGFDRASGVRMMVDNPQEGGAFQDAFSPWPVRFFILQDGKVKFVSEPGSNSDIEIIPFADALRVAAAKEAF